MFNIINYNTQEADEFWFPSEEPEEVDLDEKQLQYECYIDMLFKDFYFKEKENGNN